MKRLSLLLIISLYSIALFGQGKFASASWKSVIGKTCKNENELSTLKGYTSLGGSMMNDVNEVEAKSASLYSKGSTVIVLLTLTTADNIIHILDVIEITNVLKTQEVKVGYCYDGENEDSRIVALVNQTKDERWKATKAWLFNFDKLQVDAWPHQNVSCQGMMGDE